MQLIKLLQYMPVLRSSLQGDSSRLYDCLRMSLKYLASVHINTASVHQFSLQLFHSPLYDSTSFCNCSWQNIIKYMQYVGSDIRLFFIFMKDVNHTALMTAIRHLFNFRCSLRVVETSNQGCAEHYLHSKQPEFNQPGCQQHKALPNNVYCILM